MIAKKPQEARRRQYSDELKRQVVSECAAPGASVAKVAMSHGINANIVHTWRTLARRAAEVPKEADATPTFVPLMLAPPQPNPAVTQVHVQVTRGPVAISATWPLEAAAQLGIWTRELLK